MKVDKIFYNGLVYTVNKNFDTAEAVAIKDGKIEAVGSSDSIFEKYSSENKVDLKRHPVYPGFYDAHCHFYWYGIGLQKADLVGTSSFDDVLERVVAHRKKYPHKPWIEGRGWDQNDWAIKEFPNNRKLDSLFPNTPVFLVRIDGHAALANSKAIGLAGIDKDTTVDGGAIIKDKKGNLTGIFVDNAVDLIKDKIPEPTYEESKSALIDAQRNCFKVGLTTVDDAGLNHDVIEIIKKGYKEGWLKMHMYVMVLGKDENKSLIEKGKYQDDNLTIRSIKVYADGALGSRGAYLLENYSDKPKERGFLLAKKEYFEKWAKIARDADFQLNTHAIGDGANRLMLNIYSNYLDTGNDKRWRIEHAQIVHPDDVKKFAKYNILPSMQPTHATSDMDWADERLGKRLRYGYALKDLMETNGVIALGSDFPVEDINPLYGFYAAVARKALDGHPPGGFQMENALTRKQSLKGMTIWAAYASFEENEKGSIEPGKIADLVVLDRDIMKIPIDEIPKVKVEQTIIGGKEVFLRSSN